MDVDAMEAALNNFAISEGYEENDKENINETEVDDSEEPDINELVSQRVSTVLNEILTPQQKQDLKAKKCFNCGKNGHYAKNCRLPKKTFPRPATVACKCIAQHIQTKVDGCCRRDTQQNDFEI